MNSRTFKQGLEKELLDSGFERAGKLYLRPTAFGFIMIAFSKGFGSQLFLDVGFWFSDLGDTTPSRLENAHIYCRLERLFPKDRELILTAGALDDAAQPEAYQRLISLFRKIVEDLLREFEDVPCIRQQMEYGRLSCGLIRKEAREYLSL